mmetsp:Transcript_28774/g.48377  ORF Transcript_28774/g.48377 Transcript_28774/m.48377 type:complete len:83 (-) Transcript_28774:1799-2047(-)
MTHSPWSCYTVRSPKEYVCGGMLQRSFNKEKGGKVSLKDGYVQTGQDRTGQIIGPPSHGMMAIRVSLDATCSSLAGENISGV